MDDFYDYDELDIPSESDVLAGLDEFLCPSSGIYEPDPDMIDEQIKLEYMVHVAKNLPTYKDYSELVANAEIMMNFAKANNITPKDIIMYLLRELEFRKRQLTDCDKRLSDITEVLSQVDRVRMGIAKPAKKPEYTVARVMELCNKGHSIQETAVIMGCSVSTVKRYRRKAKSNQDVSD